MQKREKISKRAVYGHPVRNLRTGRIEDRATESSINPDTGRLYCSCGTWEIDGMTCPNCGETYEAVLKGQLALFGGSL